MAFWEFPTLWPLSIVAKKASRAALICNLTHFSTSSDETAFSLKHESVSEKNAVHFWLTDSGKGGKILLFQQ
jgi:hypothetical protein